MTNNKNEIKIDSEEEFQEFIKKSEDRLNNQSSGILIKSMKKYNKKINKNRKWSQYLAAGTCVIATFSSGIHTGWPSPSLPILLSQDHPLHLTNDEVSYVTIISTVGNIIGNIVYPLLSDRIGRKTTLLLSVLPLICSFILLRFTSNSLICLYLARLVGGVSESSTLAVVPVYIGEISEAKIRGHLITLVGFSSLLGMLFVDVVGSYNSIETTSLIVLGTPFLFLLTFCWQPESPYFLLKKKKYEETRTALRKLRRNENVEEELKELINDVNRQISEKGTYKDLFMVKSNKDALVIMISICVIYQFSGIYSIQYYSQVFFMETVTFIPSNWCSSILISLSLGIYIVSFFVVDRIGRRSILLFGITICATNLFLVSIYFFLVDYTSWNFSYLTWIPFLLIACFCVSFDFGLGNVCICLGGEIYSASVKGKATLISSLTFSICIAASTKTYQLLADNFGLGVAMIFFSVCLWLGLIFTWKFVPETKEKTLEEIQMEMKARR